MIGPHAREALLDALQNVVAGEDVRAGLAAWSRRRPHEAAALAREIVRGAPIGNIAADALLAYTVVDRRVDVVDSAVEDGVEDCLRLLVGHVAAARGAAELHGSVAQHGHLQARASELAVR